MPKNEAIPTLSEPQETGILFADISGYTQLLWQCDGDEARLHKLALAIQRLFSLATSGFPHISVEGFAGDGFLALAHGPKPATELYQLTRRLHERFNGDVRSLLMDLGFRTNVQLRCGLHVGKVRQITLLGEDGQPHPQQVNLSDAIVVASRVVTSQTSRRFGTAMTRTCYKRLLLLGGKETREPDEVIQDRNKYPEPPNVYRLREDEQHTLATRIDHSS